MGLLDSVGNAINKYGGSILSTAGTVLNAYGQYKQGQDVKEVYDYNEELAKFEAKYSQERADIETEQLKRDVTRYIGTQRAIQGASGTVVDTGSNLDAVIATEKEAAIDAAIIRRGAQVEQELALKRAKTLDKQGAAASTAGFINAGATLLSGLSKWDFRKSELTKTTQTSVGTYSGPSIFFET